jgi:hypothetical protein
LINNYAKRSLNWFNHITASSSKGGMANKTSNTLFAGWNVSENKSKLGDDSFRYKNKLLKSSTRSPESSPRIKSRSKVSFSNNTKDDQLEFEDNIMKATPENNIIESSIIDSSPTDITDLLLTYTGTNLVLDLFGGSSSTIDQTTADNGNNERQKIINNFDNGNEENFNRDEKFSKGEESLR